MLEYANNRQNLIFDSKNNDNSTFRNVNMEYQNKLNFNNVNVNY